jgi:putative MATE family efflux protein
MPMPTVWSTLEQAIRGRRVDYTSETLERAVVLLTIPMVLEMMMESIFVVVDAYWVSSLGPDAVAAVGMTEAMMTIVYALAAGIARAASAVVARRIGEQAPDRAASAAAQAFLLGIGVASAVGLAGALLGRQLLLAMGASQHLVATGGTFTCVMLGGSATVFLLFLGNSLFRSAGDAAIAMRTLWLANLLNIVLAPCLIFGLGPLPRMGVTGAAVATTIARGIGVLYQVLQLGRHDSKIAIRRRHLRVEWPALRVIARLASVGWLQALLANTSWLGLVRLLAPFGSGVVAGYTLAIRVVTFAALPAWGFSNAAATLVGQNLGARKPERAERAVWIAARYNAMFLGAAGLVFLVAPGPIIGLFDAGPEATAVGTTALRIFAPGFPLYAAAMVFIAAFNGAGDTWVPTLINAFCFWLWEIPLAIFLVHVLDLHEHGVFIAVTIAFSTVAVAAIRLFRTGRWKHRCL